MKFQNLTKNISDMPVLLKLIIASSLIVPLSCINSAYPRNEIEFFGKIVSYEKWWSSGAGVCGVILSLVILLSIFLVINKYNKGRQLYLLCLMSTNLLASFQGFLVNENINFSNEVLVVGNLLSILIFIYIAFWHSVDRYFSEG